MADTAEGAEKEASNKTNVVSALRELIFCLRPENSQRSEKWNKTISGCESMMKNTKLSDVIERAGGRGESI